MFGKDISTAVFAGVANVFAYQYVTDTAFGIPELALSTPSVMMGFIALVGVLVINFTWEDDTLQKIAEN